MIPENYPYFVYLIEIFKGTADKRGIPILEKISKFEDDKKILIEGWISFSVFINHAKDALRWLNTGTKYPYKYKNIFGWRNKEILGR
jgi:hypothetical protein